MIKNHRTKKIRKRKKLRKISDDLSVEEVAANLAAYITDREALEDVSFTLDAEFFARHLRDGVVGFFGVETDFEHDTGKLVMIRDLKEPYEGYFETWVKQRRQASLKPSSNKLTNQGCMSQEKVLFTDHGWTLIQADSISQNSRDRCFTDSDRGSFLFTSVIKHKCDYNIDSDVGPIDTRSVSSGSYTFLDEEDTVKGRCWWCMEFVPEGLNALWKLQNWNVMLKVFISDSWDADQVKMRMKEIAKKMNPKTKIRTEGRGRKYLKKEELDELGTFLWRGDRAKPKIQNMQFNNVVCDHTHRLTRTWCRHEGLDPDLVVDFLDQCSCFCDCGVTDLEIELYNVETPEGWLLPTSWCLFDHCCVAT